jgi:hypothetical protein
MLGRPGLDIFAVVRGVGGPGGITGAEVVRIGGGGADFCVGVGAVTGALEPC